MKAAEHERILVGTCPVCGQRAGSDEVAQALVTAMARGKDLCELCAKSKPYPGPECYDADCDCSVCESDCACARCEDGSNFRYGGVKNA